MSDIPPSKRRKGGRPRKADSPKIPQGELDRLLVFGEPVTSEDGRNTVQYPSYRELGQRYGVSHSLISRYAKQHNCLKRRREAQARTRAMADQRLIEQRATAEAFSREDAIRVIDMYLSGFEKAVAEGRVRFDDPNDFTAMLRLKELLDGRADSRREVHATISLEELQARHQRMRKLSEQTSDTVHDKEPEPRSASAGAMDQKQPENSTQPVLPESVTRANTSAANSNKALDAGAPERARVHKSTEPTPHPAGTVPAATETHTAPPGNAQPPEEDSE